MARKVSAYSKCVGRELKGRKFNSRSAAQNAMKTAAKKCRGR